MESDTIGVALVEVEVVIQHILAFRKTDTFPDQSRDSVPQGKVISFYVHRFDISGLKITKYYFSRLSNNSSTFPFLNKLSVVDCVRIEVPKYGGGILIIAITDERSLIINVRNLTTTFYRCY